MEPLASKIRPTNLDEFVGQQHLVGQDKPLRTAIEQRHLFSFVLWGPPGVGKTTLARIYANSLDANFFELSAVNAGKDDIRKILEQAKDSEGKPTILFLDEIHRFNKAQQDFLLPHVESGKLTLIGATTENPSFEVISALLSRCRVFTLKELSREDILVIIERTHLQMDTEAVDFIVNVAGGDARQAIGLLESTYNLYKTITVANLKNCLQNTHLRYDKKGEEHYNIISAFIKSMRASDANAAVYYLARMIDAGEDPKFIARRMIIFASEDVGLGNSNALLVANNVFAAVEKIGLPECRINLVHGVVFLAQCKKDRRAYDALETAMEDVKNFGSLPVPLKLRNAVTKLMKDSGYGDGYEMYGKDGCLPDKLKDRKYI